MRPHRIKYICDVQFPSSFFFLLSFLLYLIVFATIIFIFCNVIKLLYFFALFSQIPFVLFVLDVAIEAILLCIYVFGRFYSLRVRFWSSLFEEWQLRRSTHKHTEHTRPIIKYNDNHKCDDDYGISCVCACVCVCASDDFVMENGRCIRWLRAKIRRCYA